MSDTIQVPKFQLEKVYADGSREAPALYKVHELPRLGGCRMGRRGFLLTSGIGVGLLASLTMGCDSKPEKEPTQAKEPTLPHIAADSVSGVVAHGPHGFHCLAFNPDSSLLVSCSADTKRSSFGLCQKASWRARFPTVILP